MNKMLLLALVIAGPACAKKKEPTAPAKPVTDGMLQVSLKGITVERIVSEASSQTDDLVGWINVENTGGKELSLSKIEYSIVTGGETSAGKTWEHAPVLVAPGDSQTVELHDKVIWNGTGEFPHKEAQFQGTAYYSTGGESKTAAFKLPGAVAKKE
jgi:ABC-type Fe3+-hydroxamate transport system substrate-binding protein